MDRFLNGIGQDTHIFVTMFDSVEDLVFLLRVDDEAFRYMYVNKAGKDILKYSGNIEGKRIEEVLSKERTEFLISQYRKVVQTGQAHTFEETIIGNNGEELIGETLLNPIAIDNGSDMYIFAIVRDVSDRKKNEVLLKETKKRLENNQKRLESLIKNNQDIVYELDLNGNFKHINRSAEKLIGYKSEELIGKQSFHLIVNEDQVEASANFVHVLSGAIREYEVWVHHKEGHRVLLYIRNVPIIVDRKLEGIYGIATDITNQREMEKELDRIKDELELVWRNTSDGIFLLSQEGNILSANPSFEKMLGYNSTKIPSSQEKIYKNDFLSKLRKNKEVLNLEVKRQTRDGRVLDILASYRSINKGDILAVVMYKDITEGKKILQKLEESEKRYRKIVELSPEAIVVLKDQRINFINQTGLRLLGRKSNDSVIGEKIIDFVHVEDREKIEKFLIALVKMEAEVDKEDGSVNIKFIQYDGSIIHTEITASVVKNDGEQEIQTIIRDISERLQHEKQLSFLAYHDPLTGLLNRRAFNDAIERAVEEARHNNNLLAILYLDMDNFKDINDTLGHEVGDMLLKQFARRLESTVRGDDILCRVGGDEFLILLKNMRDKHAVIDIANRLIEIMQESYTIKGHTLKLTSSFGISLYPKDGTSPRRLIHHADVALYKAKEERNNYAFFTKN